MRVSLKNLPQGRVGRSHRDHALLSDVGVVVPQVNRVTKHLPLKGIIISDYYQGIVAYIFIRLFTAKDVNTIKKSAAHTVPISFLFTTSLLVFCMLALALPEVSMDPAGVWFIDAEQAGEYFLLGIAGGTVLAASLGHIDGHIQATGAQSQRYI